MIEVLRELAQLIIEEKEFCARFFIAPDTEKRKAVMSNMAPAAAAAKGRGGGLMDLDDLSVSGMSDENLSDASESTRGRVSSRSRSRTKSGNLLEVPGSPAKSPAVDVASAAKALAVCALYVVQINILIFLLFVTNRH